MVKKIHRNLKKASVLTDKKSMKNTKLLPKTIPYVSAKILVLVTSALFLGACSLSANIGSLNPASSIIPLKSSQMEVVSGSRQGEITSGNYVVSASMDMQSSGFTSTTAGGYKTTSSVQTSLAADSDH